MITDVNVNSCSTLRSFAAVIQTMSDGKRAVPSKIKASVKKMQVESDTSKTPPTAKGKRLKTSAKADKPTMKKQPAKTSKAKGLTVLSEVALTEAKQLKLATKRSLIQTRISHASGSSTDEGTGSIPGVPDVPTYDSDDEQISWKSSEEHNEDEVNDDDMMMIDDESNEESDEEVQGANTEDEEMDEEATHEEDEANELYRDVNVNLDGRDTMMTDAPLPNVQATQETKDTHMIIMAPINPEGQQQSSSVSSGFVSNMLNPRPDTGIDLIFTLNTEATSLVDVPVTTIAEPPLVQTTTLPPHTTSLSSHLCTLNTVSHKSKQLSQLLPSVSSIPGIVDVYLANKMHEAVKTAAQLQSERLRDEAQAEDADFLNKLDDNINKIIKDQVKEQVKAQVSKILPKIKKTVNEQLEAEVMTRSSTKSKTSLAIAANLSELELKKILIDKMESNKSIHRSDEQKNLYKELVEAYESDKLILDTYGDIVSFKRRRDDEDKYKEPSAGKEPESTSTLKEKTPKLTGKSTEGSKSLHKSVGESAHARIHAQPQDLEEPAHQEFETGATEDQLVDETPQPSDWFQKPTRLPSPYRDWNKILPADHGPV
ncbi:hypothetical protein Tco_0738802 [Tanacetum coccineum]